MKKKNACNVTLNSSFSIIYAKERKGECPYEIFFFLEKDKGY